MALSFDKGKGEAMGSDGREARHVFHFGTQKNKEFWLCRVRPNLDGWWNSIEPEILTLNFSAPKIRSSDLGEVPNFHDCLEGGIITGKSAHGADFVDDIGRCKDM